MVVVSDNGASGEGGPDGSVNENKFINGIPDDLAANLAMLDELGGPKTYNHYPTGWAMAFNTPFKMWKRYSFNGGTCDPCIISWPAGISARGEIRDQYHHAIDIVPTLLDCLGVEQPGDGQGRHPDPDPGRQHALQLRRGRASRAPARPSSTRCSAPAAIWHDGWKAVTTHPAISGWGHFEQDTWELYHTDEDRSELHDLAAEHPDRLTELIGLWFYEAGANHAFPLDDRSALEIILTPRPQLVPPRATGTSTAPAAPRSPSRSPPTSATAPTPSARRSTCPDAGAQGVLFAHGSRFGGHALYVKDNRLYYVYNFVGIIEQRVVATEDLPTGTNLLLVGQLRQGRRGPAGRRRGNAHAVVRRPQGRRGAHQDPAGQVRHRRRGPVRRAGQRRTGHRRLPRTKHRGRSPAAPCTGSPSTSAANRTSTSSAKPPPCSPANEPPDRPSRRRAAAVVTR